MSEERREQEKRKQDAPIRIPQEAKEKKPSIKIHPKPEQTEEEAFVTSMNNLINNTILDHEAIKSKTLDSFRELGQKLGVYMRECSRLKDELAKKEKPV